MKCLWLRQPNRGRVCSLSSAIAVSVARFPGDTHPDDL